MAGEEITYESLVNRWRREVTTGPTELTRIHPAFYQRVEEYLRDLQEDYQREHKINPTSGKAMILRDELFNMRKALEDIYDQRERKVVLSALAAARGSNPDKTNMTEGERELHESLVRGLKEGRREILRRHDRALEVDTPKARPAPDVDPEPPEAALTSYEETSPTDPSPRSEVAAGSSEVETGDPDDATGDGAAEPGTATLEATTAPPEADAEDVTSREPALDDTADPDEPQGAAGARDGTEVEEVEGDEDLASPKDGQRQETLSSGRVVVHVLEEVPEFTASDLRTYRLHPEDIAALPSSAARALVTHGKARLVAGALD